jgi:uncharacterized protein YcfL
VKFGGLILALLCVAGCRSDGASNGTSQDVVSRNADKLTDTVNGQVNSAIAKIEADGQEAVAALGPAPVSNATAPTAANQN